MRFRLLPMLAIAALAFCPAAARAAVAPGSYDFGIVSADQSTDITVTNDSGLGWSVGTPSFAPDSGFTVSSSSCIYLFSWDPGNVCTVTIQVAGSTLAHGHYSDTLTIPYMDEHDQAGSIEVPVTATVGAPPVVPQFSVVPWAGFVLGSTATNAAVPVRISWVTTSADTRCSAVVGRSTAGSAWDSQTLASASATGYTWNAGYRAAHQVRVQVTTCSGGASGWQPTPAFTPVQPAASAIRYSAGWRTAKAAADLGGSDRYIARKSGTVTVTLSHVRAVALVGSCAAGRGSARVALDGTSAGTFAEGCAGKAGRVLFTHRWTAAGNHTLRVTALTAKRLDVDGFVTM